MPVVKVSTPKYCTVPKSASVSISASATPAAIAGRASGRATRAEAAPGAAAERAADFERRRPTARGRPRARAGRHRGRARSVSIATAPPSERISREPVVARAPAEQRRASALCTGPAKSQQVGVGVGHDVGRHRQRQQQRPFEHAAARESGTSSPARRSRRRSRRRRPPTPPSRPACWRRSRQHRLGEMAPRSRRPQQDGGQQRQHRATATSAAMAETASAHERWLTAYGRCSERPGAVVTLLRVAGVGPRPNFASEGNYWTRTACNSGAWLSGAGPRPIGAGDFGRC